MSKLENTFYVTHGGQTLIEFLSAQLNISKGKAKELIDRKKVFVDEEPVWMAKHALKKGNMVVCYGAVPFSKATRTSLAVLYHDKDFIVVNKPAGLVTNQGSQSVQAVIRKQLKNPRITAVHRLDKDTSGCLLLATSPEKYAGVIPVFRARAVHKRYRALVQGVIAQNRFTIDVPIEGKDAVSHVKVLARGKQRALIEVTIETGRTHQIRKHLATRGLRVLGDMSYFSKKQVEKEDYRQAPRLMLHACELSFRSPFSHEEISVEAPYPDDFKRLVSSMKT